MNLRSLFFLFLSMNQLLAAVDGQVADVAEALQAGDPSGINQALVKLQLGINETVFSAPPGSDARHQSRRGVQESLAPIEMQLIELTSHPNSTVASTATTVLASAPSSPRILSALKNNLESTEVPVVASNSLFALWKLGLLDSDIEAIATRRIAGYKTPGDSDVAFNLIRSAADIPLPSAVDLLTDILKDDDRVSVQVIVAQALGRLGPDGRESLPYLQQVLDDLREGKADFRDINTVGRALMKVSGRNDFVQMTPPSSLVKSSSAESTQREGSSSLPPEVVLPTDEDDRPGLPPFLIGVVFAGALLTALLLYLRRRA